MPTPLNLTRSTFLWAALCFGACCQAQVDVRVLHAFNNGAQGYQPLGTLSQASDGTLYGTTSSAGANGYGSVFKMNPNGTGFSVVYEFGADEAFGQRIQAGIIQGKDGALYGTTAAFCCPARIFKVNADGTGYTPLHSFARNTGDGADPGCLVQGYDGSIYGTTMGGGSNYMGIVFKVDTNGANYSVLYNFGTNSAGGGSPYPGLMQGNGGILYGTAGGGSNGAGVLFKLNTNGSGYSVLHNFGDSSVDGSYPWAAPTQGTDGKLYGTTHAGGSNNLGTVFKINSDGSGYTLLHSFSNAGGDGWSPAQAPVVQGSDGALYGITESNQGGSVLYRLNPDGSGYQVLYTVGADVGTPRFSLTKGMDGSIYGTAEYGGPNSSGTIFRLSVIQSRFDAATTLPDHTFQLSLSATANLIYRIEASTDGTNWSTVTNIFNATGTMQCIDPFATNFARRFYRAVTTGSNN